jgi:1L-myo-inositol 1-phosphate cytidylyltransferase / CDP-L-myo-inositol myo-inositolphosphotransferase
VPKASDRGFIAPAGSSADLAAPSVLPLRALSGVVPRMGVVLAAGRSERLRAVTGGGSKALVELGGLKLVERAIRTLMNAGVEHILVVVGYHAGPVGAVVSRLGRGRVHAVLAERWELGNGSSLAAADDSVEGQDLFALITADHLFGEGALDRLIRAGEPAVLLDPHPSAEAWAEGCRVRIRGGMAVAFGKQIDEPPIDCGVFLLPPEVFEAQREAAAQGDHTLAGAISRLAARRELRPVPIDDRTWWQDIDTPQELHAARSRLRRSLTRDGDGPVSRYLNRPVSTRLSMALASLRISPDLFSVASVALALVGAWLLATGRGILGGIMVQGASVLDGVDGEMARLLIRAGPRGAMLDGVLDRVGDAAVMGGLGVWALGGGSRISAGVVVWLTVAATAGSLLSMASKDRAAALGLPGAPERLLGYLLGGRDGRLLFVAVGSILGHPAAALIAVTVTSGLSLALRVWFIRQSVSSAR